MRTIVLALVLAASAAMPALADYYVYCANGRIEVAMSNPQQMRSARGSGVCQMGPRFGFLSAAQDFARNNFGGVGRPCSCR